MLDKTDLLTTKSNEPIKAAAKKKKKKKHANMFNQAICAALLCKDDPRKRCLEGDKEYFHTEYFHMCVHSIFMSICV